MRRILLLLPYVGIIALGSYTYYQLKEIKLKEQEFVEYTELPQGNTVNAIAIDLPDTLSFAGEPVPMNIPDVRERLDREMHINAYWHTNTIFLLKRAHRWLPQIARVLKEEGIPDDFKFVPAIEGAFKNDISPKSAIGFWQFRKDAAREFGLEVSSQVDERYDPIKSTRAASKYLRKAYERFGNWTLVAASFNRGRSGIIRAMDNQKVDNYYDLMLNDETSRYVFRILAAKEILVHPHRYGFEVPDELLYNIEPVKYVTVSEAVDNWVDWSQQQGINYKLLKRHNPWIQSRSLKVSRGKEYLIAIPLNNE
ncbi:MAG: lytic transglycosylase domain-containing protein [Bacteroidetes bacterium]|nr:MAG: lytic transglycosylase domain-containing protein [Bacteroidota bacterium]